MDIGCCGGAWHSKEVGKPSFSAIAVCCNLLAGGALRTLCSNMGYILSWPWGLEGGFNTCLHDCSWHAHYSRESNASRKRLASKGVLLGSWP